MSIPKIFSYLSQMEELSASDLYLTVGHPPTARNDADLHELTKDPLNLQDVNEILNAVLTSRQRREYEVHMELNTSLDMGQYGRFRINVMRQRQTPALVIRRIISKIPSFEELKLPKIFEKLSMEKRGLVLIAGITGSGKTTSLAAMVDHRNNNEKGHIITIEDPIEYFHEHKKSVITQREVGVDTESYAMALKNSLRQRPDVLMIGEIRDREVMEQALTISETGHLCFATMHASNSYQAIERIVNLFPEDYTSQIRLNLSLNLRGIIAQRLIPSISGELIPIVEVMLNEAFVRELILRGEIPKIRTVMGENNSIGMCTFDQSLLIAYVDGLITEDTAVTHSDKPSDMKMLIRQANLVNKDKSAGVDALKSIDTSLISFHE